MESSPVNTLFNIEKFAKEYGEFEMLVDDEVRILRITRQIGLIDPTEHDDAAASIVSNPKGACQLLHRTSQIPQRLISAASEFMWPLTPILDW